MVWLRATYIYTYFAKGEKNINIYIIGTKI